ncbi:unnamed protein product [Arabidopsis thaliana]|uniref:Uncharacterized protein n=1 Tax=Arabidopsis thaliana TaxID=3702 RepID=A0A654G4Z8_ARATH|nr:unnamed protein product [Arabidopsis thaliana]
MLSPVSFWQIYRRNQLHLIILSYNCFSGEISTTLGNDKSDVISKPVFYHLKKSISCMSHVAVPTEKKLSVRGLKTKKQAGETNKIG